ncbi:hypothetical protein [Novosphingopyxis sp. YJ-S2-01]|uniref:hypothetical protein n=1 Tax=Novosphingopyxis sp. YJ-S2-01 TaxID=2794021 RepID=UPI0018DC0120|nr:hypothetical protein [Novosphingopyxis sp. YJ-S2-01]MBH9538058.1 hypothetical protein [Novosphingopyxis sp. YJ-S2-01]
MRHKLFAAAALSIAAVAFSTNASDALAQNTSDLGPGDYYFYQYDYYATSAKVELVGFGVGDCRGGVSVSGEQTPYYREQVLGICRRGGYPEILP